MTVYMEVTRDKYELPVVVAMTPQELAEKAGVKINLIYQSVSRIQRGHRKGGRFVKVVIEDDE